MFDLQLLQIRDTECGVDPHNKQQQITEALLPAQQMFDLGNLFSGENWLEKAYQIGRTQPLTIPIVFTKKSLADFLDKKQEPIYRIFHN